MAHNSRRTVLSFMSDDARRRSRDNQADTVHRLSLNDIRPDPGQPRHLLPAALATRFFSGELPPLLVLKTLIEDSRQNPALAEVVSSIAELAADIKGNGLISPITVYEPDGQLTHYTIETGERRYWAHWYLVNQGDEAFRQIRALIVSGKNNRLRQLSENLRREGLTAVETAIGLASLIAELQNTPVTNWYESEHLVAPQLRRVATERLQRGMWPQVIERLGYSRRHWHNYLNLLKLCDEALELAHRNRLPERRLRPLTDIENPVEQILAVSALTTGEASSPGQQEMPSRTAATRAKQPPVEAWRLAIKKLHRSFAAVPAAEINTIRAAIAADPEQRKLLTDVRDRLNEILTEKQP